MEKMNKGNFSKKENISDSGVLSYGKYAHAVTQGVNKID